MSRCCAVAVNFRQIVCRASVFSVLSVHPGLTLIPFPWEKEWNPLNIKDLHSLSQEEEESEP